MSCMPLHPHNKLPNTLSPVDTDFRVTHDFQELNSAKGAAHPFTFENRPGFVFRLNRGQNLQIRSKHTAAEGQLCQRLGDLAELPLACLAWRQRIWHRALLLHRDEGQ